MRRLLLHLHRHSIGYLALFVALGGTSYAALELPSHSIDPVNMNPRFTAGYLRAWASVAANGRVISSAGRPTVRMHQEPVPPGDYDVFWRTRPTSGCVALADVDARGVGPGGALAAGYATPETTRRTGQDEETTVLTYDPAGQPTALPFDVALLCATPR